MEEAKVFVPTGSVDTAVRAAQPASPLDIRTSPVRGVGDGGTGRTGRRAPDASKELR